MARGIVTDCQAATVAAAGTWTPERRDACIALLETAARRLNDAVAVWEGVLGTVDASDVPFTAVVHFGAERARSLQGLYFAQKALAAELTAQTGVVYRDALDMDDSIAVVQPWDQLRAGESTHDRARSAIETMRGRTRRLAETIAALRAGPADVVQRPPGRDDATGHPPASAHH